MDIDFKVAFKDGELLLPPTCRLLLPQEKTNEKSAMPSSCPGHGPCAGRDWHYNSDRTNRIFAEEVYGLYLSPVVKFLTQLPQ